jgi:hypothetical protein
MKLGKGWEVEQVHLVEAFGGQARSLSWFIKPLPALPSMFYVT